jgi:hypothetical protein
VHNGGGGVIKWNPYQLCCISCHLGQIDVNVSKNGVKISKGFIIYNKEILKEFFKSMTLYMTDL